MILKRHQVALLSFALGILSFTFISGFIIRHYDENIVMTSGNIGETAVIKVFFLNTREDPQTLYCDRTYSVERTVYYLSDNGKTRPGQLIYLAIIELLRGPFETEQGAGYFSSINKSVRLVDVIIENGVAKIDFNGKLNEGVAGSCRVQAIRSQIEETLMQFPEVKKVVISINGDSEGILQP